MGAHRGDASSGSRSISFCVPTRPPTLYAAVTDAARGAAGDPLSGGRLASPFTAREVYRKEWTGLTEPPVVQGVLECLEELGGRMQTVDAGPCRCGAEFTRRVRTALY